MDDADDRPLLGKRVLVTRAREQASSLSSLLLAAGAEPIEVPTIQIESPSNWDEVDRAIARIETYDWIVFTSVNGVHYFLQRLETLRRDSRALAKPRIAAIGPATATALEDAGLHADFVPPEYVAEAVAEGLIELGVAGCRALIARAAGAREALVTLLRNAGARVDVVAVYHTVGSTDAGRLIRDILEKASVDAVSFTSSSTVRNLLAALDGDSRLLAPLAVACIGPITATTARELGLRVDAVATEYTTPGLVEALESYYRR